MDEQAGDLLDHARAAVAFVTAVSSLKTEEDGVKIEQLAAFAVGNEKWSGRVSKARGVAGEEMQGLKGEPISRKWMCFGGDLGWEAAECSSGERVVH